MTDNHPTNSGRPRPASGLGGGALPARGRRWLKALAALAVVAALIILPGRSADSAQNKDRLTVIATTGIIADLARNVAGEHAKVFSLVPEGGDPHTYEPRLRDVREIVRADLALSNYMMLEEQSLIRTIDANLPKGTPHVALAEEASGYGAEIIPLVENHALDTVWLGLRVRGGESVPGADRLSQVRLMMVDAQGPGAAFAYVTGTFGKPIQVFSSADGVDASNGYRDDSTTLPIDAHTHLSWAFTKPGIYKLTFKAQYLANATARPRDISSGTLTIAVGTDPSKALPGSPRVLSSGHVDIAADLSGKGDLYLYADREARGPQEKQEGKGHKHDGHGHDPRAGHRHADDDDNPLQAALPLANTVISVPPKALMPIPAEPSYRFIGRPGSDVYQLPQAVLGKHVHGEIDPHLWQDVGNAQAYVEVIRDQLIRLDPQHASDYRANAEAYLKKLDETDQYLKAKINGIPKQNRHLVTTHDAYGYLGHAYGLDIAGFVAPTPGSEPSIVDRRRLALTLNDLKVPAVFLEPNAPQASRALLEAADRADIRVCRLYGDAFTKDVTTYIDMMRYNADSLASCLNPTKKGNK
ncbi:anchored repeat ABC transporter, substrate-binding protein [Dermabacteraceae bacterium P13136]